MATNAYFLPLATLPAVIAGPGNYITRSGEPVTIAKASGRHDFGCNGTYRNGVDERWHKSGRLLAGCETANDIVRAA